ncbi:MAG: hypothetical protein OQK70_13365 [Gammaproteobacteria bacterium]|nr:hypothetical protein [Gammaproteobacteria bacterium]
MKLTLETILLKSPVFLQNLAFSIYGLKTQLIRYGGNYNNYYKSVLSHYKFDMAKLNKYMESAFLNSINDAAKNVPYYRELINKNNIDLNGIHSLDDLKILPLLEKSEIRKSPASFINERFDVSKLFVIHTTGTTGTPLKIYSNAQSRQKNYAFYNRFLSNVGIDVKGKRATFGGRIIVSSDQQKPPFWRYSYFQKNLLFSSYHLTNINIPIYIQKLRDYRPDYIDSYPSSLFCISQYAKSHNIDLRGVTKGITTSAETLFPEQRSIIESVFGVPVYDQYGAAEMCVFVSQCVEGKYHIHTDYGLVEFLREDGTSAEPGEESEIVCTSFINPVMPLIRYRIGDRGSFSDKKCNCGSPFPVMEKISGRKDDVIITPDGKKIGRLSPVMKGFPVKEMQFIQRKKSEVDVLIVKESNYDDNSEFELIKQLRKRLGDVILIKIEYVDKIHRSKGAKLKSIVSLLDTTP